LEVVFEDNVAAGIFKVYAINFVRIDVVASNAVDFGIMEVYTILVVGDVVIHKNVVVGKINVYAILVVQNLVTNDVVVVAGICETYTPILIRDDGIIRDIIST
jgi:hypothetical protein